MKVLIADDDPMWRTLLSQNIQSWDYEVVPVENGQSAWDVLQKRDTPRIAILDWQMPELDGIEICCRIRNSLNLPFIYTIILTSRDTRDDMLLGFESGADDYLVKPVDMAILRSRLMTAERIVKAVPPPRQIPGYQLIGRIGAGANAVVYKARQVSLDRLVAIKILPKKSSQNPQFVKRFYAEGRSAARLNHPNIVAALDVGKHADVYFFIMEYVEGHTVYEHLVKEGSYPERDALAIVIQIAKALDHAHKAGLIHRDVKPGNILITTEGIAKLADMGLARAVSNLEVAKAEAGKTYGTPNYIAPEQIRGEIDIDGRADIYGLGATFYHMLTGRPPFMSDGLKEVLRKHLKEPLVPPDHINTGLSAGISEVIEIMMAKRKEDRYNKVEELLTDLEAIRNGKLPLLVHKSFDLSVLEQLKDGEEIELEEEIYIGESITKYRMVILILSLVIVVLALTVIGFIIHSLK
jgi:serine/threonine-protein kinase